MAEVGDLIQLTTGGWVRLGPAKCPNRHPFGEQRLYPKPRRCIWHDNHNEWQCPHCGVLIIHPAWEDRCREAFGIGERDKTAREAQGG